MNALKMCLNWKVIAGVALAAAGIFVFAPGFAAAALPLLVLAICPLSMVVMMSMTTRARGAPGAESPTGTMSVEPSRLTGPPAGQLANLKARQQDLARQIATLESETSTTDMHRVDAAAAMR